MFQLLPIGSKLSFRQRLLRVIFIYHHYQSADQL